MPDRVLASNADARSLWRRVMQCVNPPSTSRSRALSLAASAIVACALCSSPLPARAAASDGAPYTAWLQGIVGSAQALSDGEVASAVALARTSVSALPEGPATQRARLALGLALKRAGQHAEGTKQLDASVGAIDQRIAADVVAAFEPRAAETTTPAPAPTPPASSRRSRSRKIRN